MIRRGIACALGLLLLLSSVPAFAALDDAEAWKLAKEIVTRVIKEEEDGSNLRFAILDYRVARRKDVYSVYSDVKYENAAGDACRDYFGLIFRADGDAYGDFTLMIGERIVRYSALDGTFTTETPYAE